MSKTSPISPKAAVAAVALLVAAVLFVVLRPDDNTLDVRRSYAFYYSLADGAILVDDAEQIPPFTTASGIEAVRAVVYSCSACDEPAKRFVAWLEQYTPKGRNRIVERRSAPAGAELVPLADDPVIMANTQIAAAPEAGAAPTWLAASSPAAEAVTAAVLERCPDSQARLTACAPTPADVR